MFPFDDLYERLKRGEALDFAELLNQFPADAAKIDRLRLLGSELGRTRTQDNTDRPRRAKSMAPTVRLDEPSGPHFFRGGERESPGKQPGLEPGRVLDKFRLVRRIGSGGMGEVWEAQQLSLGGRRVALKFIRPDRVGEQALGMFAREARAGARLQHPGIVAVHESGETDGFAWIAMDFIEGCWTLRDSIVEMSREAELPSDYDTHVAELVALVADALQAAHEAEVIHRDLKPQNILIDAADRPRIADFGLARIVDETELSRTGDFAGTYHYMSPEQVTARRTGIDLRTDIFSLGVILYEMITLRRPFNGDTTHQVAAQIVAKDPPDPRTIRSRVPIELAVIAGKALEKDPDKRFQTMAEFAADLRRFLAHVPILARAPTPWDRGLKWMWRHPTVSSVGSLLVITFVVVAWMSVQLTTSNAGLVTKSKALEAATERAKESERLAIEMANEGLALSAIQDFKMLEEDANRLWPADPDHVAAYESWLDRARLLIDGGRVDTASGTTRHLSLRDHEAKLDELRKRAKPASSALESLGIQGADSRDDRAPIPSDFVFEDSNDAWWFSQLNRFVDDLRAFEDEKSGGLYSRGTSAEHGWGIKKRLEVAQAIGALSQEGQDLNRGWREALQVVSRDSRYAGVHLNSRRGLVPIGSDPVSHLLEFADLMTSDHPAQGYRPPRDEHGRIVREPGMGLVFVLVPGGTCYLGVCVTDIELGWTGARRGRRMMEHGIHLRAVRA